MRSLHSLVEKNVYFHSLFREMTTETSNKINPTIRTEILTELKKIERDEEVTILYACESGSRAWGFESTDSDYDVRFIYLRKTAWYLTTQQKRDVIERPINDELDISGWDLPKALNLLKKSNPPLLEWLQSPIIYKEVPESVEKIRELMPMFYSPISCMYHYLHMGEKNFRQYVRDDEVWIKKYFYVLRPVLACRWIERGLGVVPIEFQKLVDATLHDNPLLDALEKLLIRKRSGEELDRGPKIPIVSDFLAGEIERLNAETKHDPTQKDPDLLDKAFLSILVNCNGRRI